MLQKYYKVSRGTIWRKRKRGRSCSIHGKNKQFGIITTI